jgi:hypothetical protein
MAFPIFAIIIVGCIIVVFALFKDEIIAILKELAIDFVFGLIFTIILDLVLPLNRVDIIICIFGIMAFIFLIHIFKAPLKGQQGMPH